MRIAVLTLTRDRLESTKHCFDRLWKLAGIDFDHYIFDQGSSDDTPEWLRACYDSAYVELSPENIGISRALNRLLDKLDGEYDVVVKIDNDCELESYDTLRVAAEIAADEVCPWLVSPHIQGLNFPPAVESETHCNGHRLGVVGGNIGGIFLAAPGWLFADGYRHNESNPIWGMDDVDICSAWKRRGGQVGYMLDYPANHYLTTAGQEKKWPDYWARKLKEFSPDS